jgi:hypothetical protein
VEDPEHQNGAAIVPLLKGVGATEHPEEEFAVFLAVCYGSSQHRMPAENVSSLDKFVGDVAPRGRETVRGGMQQIDRGRRATTRSLLARPSSKSGRAPRAEPPHHTIVRHGRAFRGPARSTIPFCNLIDVGFPGCAVKGGKFGDQLGDGYAELGCSGLEHLRGMLIDLRC